MTKFTIDISDEQRLIIIDALTSVICHPDDFSIPDLASRIELRHMLECLVEAETEAPDAIHDFTA